jgi:hypothetical protein
MPSHSTLTVAFVFAALLGPGSRAALAQSTDPFAPGLRWRHSSSQQVPWLPRSVDLGAGGEWVWGAGSGAAARWMLLPTQAPAQGSRGVRPRFVDPGAQAWLGTLQARASDGGENLYAAAAYQGPAGSSTSVSRYDAVAAAAGAAFQPLWTHDMQWAAGGVVRLEASRDGSIVVCAVHDSLSNRLRIDWIGGASGQLLARRDLLASTLRRTSLSSNGERLAVVAGPDLWILDFAGMTVHREQLASSTNALALSGDGQSLLVGAGGSLRVLVAKQGAYRERFKVRARAGELVSRAAISDDGGTYALGWWDSIDGRSVRLEVWDAGDARLLEIAQPGVPGGPQNFPEVIRVSPDGRRVAFGLWGAGDARPDLILYDRDLAANVLAVDLPGSVLAMDLDPAGRRVAVGMKHVHANQLGGTGDVLLYDTGECDLAMLAAPRAGRTLPIAARRPGARAILFLVGTAANTPRHLPGATGALWLDRSAAIGAFGVSTNGTGRAGWTVDLDPHRFGVGMAIQTLARVGGQVLFSQCALFPVVL